MKNLSSAANLPDVAMTGSYGVTLGLVMYLFWCKTVAEILVAFVSLIHIFYAR